MKGDYFQPKGQSTLNKSEYDSVYDSVYDMQKKIRPFVKLIDQ
jgi:hypothetical protein